MIEAGGTMAMFVLRLAGLLSLEKVLDNSTATTPAIFTNLSSSNLNLENSYSLLPKADSLIGLLAPNGSQISSEDAKRHSSNKKSVFKTKLDNLNEDWKSRKNYEDESSSYSGDHMYHDEDGVEQEFLRRLGQPLKDQSHDNVEELKPTEASVKSRTTGYAPVLKSKFDPPLLHNPTTDKPLQRKRKFNKIEKRKTKKIMNDKIIDEKETTNKKMTEKDLIISDLIDKENSTSSEFSSFDYLNDSVSYEPPPPLSSLSLIIPLPKRGKEQEHEEYIKSLNKTKKIEEKNAIINSTKTNDKSNETKSKLNESDINSQIKNSSEKSNNNKPEVIETDTNTSKMTKKTKIVTNITRNNPYPYGPQMLPDHSKQFIGDYNVSSSLGHVFGDYHLMIDQNSIEDDASFKQKFVVKTEKPPVLFHFDKPGYSPKIPESSLSPTRAPTPSDPWNCSPKCPSYELVDWNPDYDIRQYPVTTWISTVIIANNRILAELEGYMRVQDYFYGLNDRGQLLNMTIPFVTQIQQGHHPGVINEVTDYSVSLYVNHIDDPFNYDLPTPISNEVLIDRLESKTVFVSGFEAKVWEVTESFLNNKAAVLMEKLRHNGEAFLDRYYYLASYSRPELYQPVYYELWVYATTFRANVHVETPSMAPRKRPPPNTVTIKSMNKLCRGVECPPFEVLRTYRYGIQKRRYFDGLFATTTPGVCEFSTLSVWKGFMPLHLYKHGINSHMEVIEATRPIALVHVKENSTETTECPQNLTMAIYLPKRLHSNPPLTGYDAPLVTVNALQDVVVYAYTVGGYLLEPHRVRKELADLKHRLTEFGACYKDDEYYVVVYDFIVRYHGRQNEIWIVAENCKATKNG